MGLKQFTRNALATLISKVPPGLLTDTRFFDRYQRAGWHATPVHFYQPIPDTRELGDEIWEHHAELVGVEMNESGQLQRLQEFRRILQTDALHLELDEVNIFWNEQYLLRAFLSFNSEFEVLWGSSYMHLRHSRLLAACFDSYNPQQNWPTSLWMRRVSC